MELYDRVKSDLSHEKLGVYYGNFEKGIRAHYFDEEDVVCLLKDGKRYYNPCQVAEYAIINHDQYLLYGNDHYKLQFKKQLNWLVREAVKLRDAGICWQYHYDSGKEKAPWCSCIAQGVAISALLRGFQLFGDEIYRELAIESFEYMNRSTDQGGFRFSDDIYGLWYEEDNFQQHILNGHIYALLGVYDLYRVSKDESYLRLFDNGIDTIKCRIKDFDLGFSTKYDVYNPYPANNSYHFTHITLFKILYKITGDVFFKSYTEKFEMYVQKRTYRFANYLYITYLVINDRLGLIKEKLVLKRNVA